MRNGPKSILITGASRGFGMLAAVELSRRGHRVFAGVRSLHDSPKLDEACRRAGVQLEKLQLDVTAPETIDGAVQHVVDQAGGIDVLINNAGIVRVGFFETMAPAQFEDVVRTNFFGMVATARATIPIMRRQGHGTIINMSSMYGFVGAAVSSAYAASKWAVEGWSESLRFELKPRGVYVSLVEAGHFATDMLQVDDSAIHELNGGDPSYRLALDGMIEQYRKHIVQRASDPMIVARLLTKLAEKSAPKLRYAVGADSKLVRLLRSLLPWLLFEALFVAIVRSWMKGPRQTPEAVIPALPRTSM